MASLPGGGRLTMANESVAGFHIREIIVEAGNPVSLYYTESNEQAQLHFQLRGSVRGATGRDGIPAGAFSLFYEPVRTVLVAPDSGDSFHSLSVYLPESLLADAAFSHTLQQVLLAHIKRKESYHVPVQHKPVAPSLLWSIANILSCSYEGSKRTLYLEAKLASLSLLSLLQLRAAAPATSSLTYDETIRLLAVKAKAEKESRTALPLQEIIKKVDLNDRAGRAGFKKLFGTDIATYVPALRLEQAFRAVVETDESLDSIAAAAGYKNVSSFITAFKGHYALATPAAVRKYYTGRPG
jgi:AraC-like DNA-binding protein